MPSQSGALIRQGVRKVRLRPPKAANSVCADVSTMSSAKLWNHHRETITMTPRNWSMPIMSQKDVACQARKRYVIGIRNKE
jgi:hypothetical protein